MEYKVFYECDKNKCSIKKYRDKQTHKMICGPCKFTSDPRTNWFNPKDIADNMDYIPLE